MPENTYISRAQASANLAEMANESMRALGRNVGEYGDWMGDVGTSSAIGRGVGAYGLPLALSYFFPQMSLPLLALSSLIGSWTGSEVGQRAEGPPPKLRTPDVLLGEQDLASQEQDFERMLSSFDASQITDAIGDMTNYFKLTGGTKFLQETPYSFSDWFSPGPSRYSKS